MNLNKKLIVLALASTVSISALATTETFTANVTGLVEPAIANSAAVDFGDMALAVGSTCTMDNAAATTGDCANTGGVVGAIEVTSLTIGTRLTVLLETGVGANVTYVPEFDLTGAVSAVTSAPADVPVSVVASATSMDIVAFGALSVTTALTAAGAFTASYDVTVDFE